jgi:hypothetical protein
MNGVDLARFEFDYDTTWQAFFLDAELSVYSRYGGRDENSPDGRLSKESLLTTMHEVLEVHERRKGGAGLADDFQPAPPARTTPEDIPLLKASHQGCVHCHQVQEYRILQSFHDKKFSQEQLFGYPLPENLGVRFDRSHGHRVEKLIEGSPATQAGLAAGDVVIRVGDVPVHSEQDLRWALHRAPKEDRPTLTFVRNSEGNSPPRTLTVQLALGPGWRQAELGWRKSLRSMPLPLGFLAYPMGPEERHDDGFPEGGMLIKVVSLRGHGLAENLGLKKGDLITALAGRTEPRTFDDLKSDLLRRYSPGDTVQFSVLRDGKTLTLEGPFPDWYTNDTSVP